MAHKPTYEELEQRIRKLEPAEASLRASEARFRSMIEKSPMGIAIVNDQYQYTYVNNEFCNIVGYSAEEILGANFFFVLAEESKELSIERYLRRQRGESVPDRYEVSFIKKDGSRRTAEVQSVVFMDTDGRAYSLLQVYDITDRKVAEAGLMESEKNFRALVENAGEAIFVAQDGRIKFANPTTSLIVGHPLEQLQTLMFTEFLHPDDRALVLDRHLRRLRGEQLPSRYPFRIVTADGRIRWVELNTVAIEWEGRSATLNFLTDITDRRIMEEALSKSEANYRFLFENTDEGILLAQNGNILFSNPALSRISGYTDEEIRQKPFLEFVHPEDRDMVQSRYSRRIEGNAAPQVYAFRILTPSGLAKWVQINSSLIAWEGKPATLTFVTDISSLKEAEKALQKSQERFQRLLDVVPDMISIQDPDMRIVYSNWNGFGAVPKGKRVLGSKCHETYRGFTAICPDCEAKKVMTEKRPFQVEKQILNGRWVEVRVIPLLDSQGEVELFMEWVRDVTAIKQEEQERQKLQALLVQAQKMESVGRLAGGVAHDFNNMLGVILGHAELALMKCRQDQPIRHTILEIQKAAQRAADLTGQLLAFARKQAISPKQLQLNDTVNGMITMIRRLIGEDIDLIWNPGPDLWPVRVDPTQVDQILANLCVNARDAIAGVGAITINTRNVYLDDAFCAGQEECPTGDYVLLQVRDNGCGMDASVLKNLFEPFFTTKAVGKGTGLGLAMIYGIVRQNNGLIRVESEPGKGATFNIYLPRDEEAGETTPDDARNTPETGGHETILLVEDEPSILSLCCVMLEGLGYHVVAADSPASAIAKAGAHTGPIDLLLTDVIMPEMNGRELADRLRAIHPEIKTLFMSGYTADVIAHRGILDRQVNFIQKPFTMGDLASGVRRAMGRE